MTDNEEDSRSDQGSEGDRGPLRIIHGEKSEHDPLSPVAILEEALARAKRSEPTYVVVIIGEGVARSHAMWSKHMCGVFEIVGSIEAVKNAIMRISGV